MAGFSLAGRLRVALAPHPSDNAWLDFLRTLAIVLVLLRHGQRMVTAGPELSPLEVLFINGWAGVDLFLVLSGYLVTKGLSRAFGNNGRINVVDYARKRVRRIVPAYLFVLALVVVGYFPFFAVSTDHLAARVGYHILFLQDYLPSDINVVFWSLGVEAKFYALVPLLVLLVTRLQSRWAILGVVLGVAAVSPVVRGIGFAGLESIDYQTFWRVFRSPFHACLEPLMFGFLVAVLEGRGFLRLSGRNAGRLFAVGLAALVVWLSGHEFLAEITLWDAVFQPLGLALLFAVLLAAAINMEGVRLPLTGSFRFGARISYALYLVHFPLIPLCLFLTERMGAGAGGFWVIYLALSVAHAVLILAYVELPFLARKSGPARAVTARAQIAA
jgi:peptidoglycan/LPS O-acetylase OafA/YrhL